MLFGFYMVTPYVVKGLEKIRYGVVAKSLVVIFFSICFIYALSCASFNYDVRLSYTMPFYGLGLIFGKEIIVKKITSKWYIMLVSALFLILLHYFGITGEQYLHIDTVTAIVLFLSICYWMQFLPISKIISVLSYASMSMYLFHRSIFHLGIKYLFHNDKVTITEMYLVLMPIVIVVSYIIQYSYDFCLDKIEHRK